MKHIHPYTAQQPRYAQSGGNVGKALINSVLFGVSPALTLLFKASTGGGDE